MDNYRNFRREDDHLRHNVDDAMGNNQRYDRPDLRYSSQRNDELDNNRYTPVYRRDNHFTQGNYNKRYMEEMSQREPRNMYGGDTSNHGNLNQGGFDRTWSRIPDVISSWFGGKKEKGKGPKGYHPSEERIREQVCDRLTESPVLDASEIEIKVDGSEVILEGTVETRADKRLAEDIAESVSGVRDVHNRLRLAKGEKGLMGENT